MSQPNPYISNGTCYTGKDAQADSDFIPCGNAAFGHLSCCSKGDMCLADRACYNGQFGTTYLIGCTDPEYSDGKCPQKQFDIPWVGLVYCNGTSNEWVACPQAAKNPTLTKPDPCWCLPEAERTAVAFKDSSVLENIASLPTATGLSILWQTGHVPAVTVLAPGSNPGSSSGATASQTPTSAVPTGSTPLAPGPTAQGIDDAQGQSSGMSTGAKAGLGVGLALAAAGILFGVFLFLRRRRKAKMSTAEAGEYAAVQHDAEGDKSKGPGPAELSAPHTPAMSELEPKAARPWSMRSELESRSATVSPLSGHNTGTWTIPEGQSLEGSPRVNGTPGGQRAPGKNGFVAELPG
ncbi:hypothetical protein QBC39DRAFT_183017 [Podospora conica]|nr:hypothetical protein QBC39DRAFT_183017 [Schizothecium conicum]